MSHDQGRPTGCQGEGGPLHHGLGGRIQGHGGLIQQQNVGVNQTRPGQCEQLQLTGGQIAPTRGDLMQVPVVECGDHRMGTDLPRSPFDLGIGGIGPSVCDGIADRPGEDVLLLRHDAEPVAIAVDIELPQVASVDSDRPMGRIVEPRHQLDQGARTCFVNEDGVPWSSENASIFTTPDSIRKVFDAQRQLGGQDHPTVIEVTDSERPLSGVFAAGSLVHHRFRTASGSARSCIILVFHRVADNPGRMVSDVEDSSDVSLSELLTRGVPDESYQQRFIATLCAAADEIAELLLKWKKTPQRPVSLPLQTKQIDGARFEEWISAATEAPEVREIRNRELTIPYGEVLSAEEFFDLIWRLMRFDKHGPLDLILYHDNREEPRKWARNLIREMSADRLYERLLGWLADIQQPRPADCLRPLQIHALISEVLKTLPLDEDQDPPADWHFDLLGMSHAEAARSVKHLLEDVAEALLRCEDMAAYLSTSLFAFWAVDAAYSLDGRRNLVVKDCARRLLRHYTMLSLTCFQ